MNLWAPSKYGWLDPRSGFIQGSCARQKSLMNTGRLEEIFVPRGDLSGVLKVNMKFRTV